MKYVLCVALLLAAFAVVQASQTSVRNPDLSELSKELTTMKHNQEIAAKIAVANEVAVSYFGSNLPFY